jgi:hypothetical protein
MPVVLPGHRHVRARRRAANFAVAGIIAVVFLGFASIAKADSVTANFDDYLPSNVSPDRWTTLVYQDTIRWGLLVDGSTDALAGEQDGVNTVGFTPYLDDATLGQTTFWTRPVYKYWRVKKCHRTSSGRRRCHWVKRKKLLYELIVENDTAINANEPWNPGPGYPAIDEYDLESVLLHELDHYAYPNREHRPRCSGAALATPLDTGEWWRGYDDWFMFGCGLDKRAPRTASGRLGRFDVVYHRLSPLYTTDSGVRGKWTRKVALP